jgi:hypothetical protein
LSDLPELAGAVTATRDAALITLRLLLTNASGLAYDDVWGAAGLVTGFHAQRPRDSGGACWP